MKPSNRHFCLIPLRFQLANDGATILSLAQHKEDLVISLTGGLLLTCKISNLGGNSKDITYSAKKAIIEKLKNERKEIVKLGSVGDVLLALVKEHGKDYGGLMSIAATHMALIAKNVLCFDINSANSFNNDLSPMFAAVIGPEIHIFTLSKEEKDGEMSYSWTENNTEVTIQEIRCITLSYPYIFSISDQGFSYITLQDNSVPIITNYKMQVKGESFCMSYLVPKYYIYCDKKAILIDPNRDFSTLKINLEETYYEHTRVGNDFASVSSSTVAIYNFTKQYNKNNRLSIVRFPGCKHITSFNNKHFIATSDTQFYLVTDCSAAVNKILEGSLDEAIESLEYVNTDILAAIFEQLWQKDYKIYALSMLKFKELYQALYDIATLFKMIKLPTCGSGIKYLYFSEQTEDQKLAKVLTDNLLSIRSSKALIDNKSNSAENRENKNLRIIIDTTLFEIYAYQEDIGNLSSFINECPELSNESIDAFFNGAETVSRAMYLAYIGNSKDSLAIFKRLENLNAVVLDQVTPIIINTSSNWEFCKENLMWLFEVSPLHACKVLTSDSISSNNALKFCFDNFPKYYNIVLYGVLDHKDMYNRTDLINQYARHIFQLLLEISEKSFDREKVAFCKCVIENTSSDVPTPIEKIKEELGDDFINVLRRFPKEIDINNPTFQSNQISSNPRVQVEIYRASGKVEEALRLIWDENKKKIKDDPSIVQELENFCKESDDTSAAFQILIKLLKEKLPNEQGMKMQMGVLSRNMNMIDIPAALANINEDELVENVADFLEETYRTLVTMRKDAELDAAFAESNEFESMYQRIRLESQAIEIRNDTICPKCKKPLNSMYLLRAPNGTLYHWKCIDANNNNI